METILPADIVTDRGDYLTIKAYLKESERKLVEERKLYAILREDGNRLEQQVALLKSENESNKKAKKGEKSEEGGVKESVVVTNNTNNLKRSNKAYAEIEERKIKELELSLLKLKEENAVIRG